MALESHPSSATGSCHLGQVTGSSRQTETTRAPWSLYRRCLAQRVLGECHCCPNAGDVLSPNDTAEVPVSTKPTPKRETAALQAWGPSTGGVSLSRALPLLITTGHLSRWPLQCPVWGPLAGRVPPPSISGNLGNATPTSKPTWTEPRVALPTLDPTRSREESRPVALWSGAQALGQTGRGPQVALPLAGCRTLEHQVTSLDLRCHLPGREERYGVRNNT